MDTDPFRERLEHDKERVQGLITGLQHELGDESETESADALSSVNQHPADLASDTFEREKDLSILEGLERELAEIEAALGRIDDGTYGLDERTGEPIDTERLDAEPTARTNLDGTGSTGQ